MEFEGWTIPDGMPLKDSSKVGRVDLSTLTWAYDSTQNRYTSEGISNSAKFVDDATVATNLYCTTQHTNKSANDVWAGTNGVAIGSAGTIWYKNESTSSTVKPSGYLYYELATAKTQTEQNAFDKLNESLVEQKMLGWTVPSECPIQNEVSGNQFIQKVGRVDLGSETSKNLSWTKYDGHGFNTRIAFTDVKPSGKCYMYDYPQGEDWEIPNAVSITGNNLIIITDDTYASVDSFLNAMSGKYLYYELETPITDTKQSLR